MVAAGQLTHTTDLRALRAGRDTGIARLPAIPQPNTGNAHLDTLFTAIKEHLEVRNGSRGNDAERVVTQRELQSVLDTAQVLKSQVDALASAVTGTTLPMTPEEAVKRFQDSIRQLKLYQDLMKSLNDPTRFDDLRGEIREELLRSLSLEAKKLGASITQIQKLTQETNLSLAMRVDQLTSAVQDAASGVRETQFATSELGRAQAGLVTQIEAQLDKFYTEGLAGVAKLEEQMVVTADRVDGLSSQYTIKLQAGGAAAGIGLSATEKDGVPDSAFIVVAGKFSLVSPNYKGGVTNTPPANSIPFGVDTVTGDIYMNANVYLSGMMRIQGGDKTLSQGLRGSLQLNAGTGAWSDVAASQKIWTALGNAGAPIGTAHLVIGDMITIGSVTRYWNGVAWGAPGTVITGDLLVDGTIAASKINTNGLTIKDANGNVILGAGTALSASYIANLPTSKITGLGTLATQNTVTTGQVTGLGAMATKDAAVIGSTVTFPDGSKMGTADFISRLQKIGSGNIGTFVDGAAITTAYIGTAAVGTLQVAGGAITTMRYGSGGGTSIAGASGAETRLCYLSVTVAAGASGVVLFGSCTAVSSVSGQGAAYRLSIRRNGVQVAVGSFASTEGGRWSANSIPGFDSPGAGTFTYELWGVCGQEYGNGGWHGVSIDSSALTATGGQR